MTTRLLQPAGVLAALVMLLLVAAPHTTQAADYEEHLGDWEQLEHQRAELVDELRGLEEQHQNSVETIESLKDDGDTSDAELRDELRTNHRTAEALEQLQRRLRDVDADQAELRAQILADIDEQRRRLEEQLRDSDADERAELVDDLNELQQVRRQFSAPLPEADRRRVDEALADAQNISDDHPRAMLAAADELEDTHDHLVSRLDRVEQRIDELQQLQTLHRNYRQFGTVDRFFDEGQRSRTIVDREQATETDDDSDGDSSDEYGELNPHVEEQARELPDSFGDTEEREESASGDDSNDFHSDQDNDTEQLDGNDPEPGAGGAPPSQEDHGDDVAAGDTDNGSTDDPFDDASSETVVIESETDPEYGDEAAYMSDSAIEHNLRQLQRERESLRQQARQLRRIADELREDAEESY